MDDIIDRIKNDKDLMDRIMNVINSLIVVPDVKPAVIPATLPVKRKCVFGFGNNLQQN